MKTVYTNRVYFPKPLTISHPKEEEDGDTAISFDLFLPTGASQRRRRLITNEREPEDDDEGLTMLHPLRPAPQVATKTLVGDAFTSRTKGAIHIKVEAEIELEIISEEHSFSIVACCMDYCRSTIT